MGLTNTQKIVLSLVLFLVLLIGWGLYPVFFKWLMVGLGTDKIELADFGSLGDIYGSLTALFTSATLIIVLYSAYLQNQANKDAKESMANQLQQARDSTAKQLRQARLSTKEQLALARATHDAQMYESKHAIFVSMFNTLLTFKENSKRYLQIKRTEEDGYYNFEYIFLHMEEELDKMIKDSSSALNGEDRLEMLSEFLNSVGKIDESSQIMDSITSYFLIYQSILRLIKKSSLLEEEKEFYYELLGKTMSTSEQSCFIWFITAMEDVAYDLIDTKLLWLNCQSQIEFINKFHERSFFSNNYFLNAWDDFLSKQKETPA